MCEQWRDINKKGARRPARFRLYSCVPSKITVLRARSADGSLKGSRVARFDSISRGLALPPIVKIERNNLRTMVSKILMTYREVSFAIGLDSKQGASCRNVPWMEVNN